MNSLTFATYPPQAEVEPYAVGQEFVIFLTWMPRERAFVRMMSNDTAFAYAIEDGRVRSGGAGRYLGAPGDELLNDLTTLSTNTR